MREGFHSIPTRDPVNGGELYISELTGQESGVTIRGKFAVPRYASLSEEQARFLGAFLRNRGNLSAVEKELGQSYPTLRNRLDDLLKALDLVPSAEPTSESARPARESRTVDRLDVLARLERGEITPSEARDLLNQAQ